GEGCGPTRERGGDGWGGGVVDAAAREVSRRDRHAAGGGVEDRHCWWIAKIVTRSAGRIEHRLRRVQEAEPIRPAVVIRVAVVVLPGEVHAVRRVLRRPRAPLVFTVFAQERPASPGFVVGRV